MKSEALRNQRSGTQPIRRAMPGHRLTSLDALRGFDMFWIIGARAVVNGLAGVRFPGAAVVAEQLVHSGWNGFTFYDLIFPLFLFMLGVSLVFSLRKRLERGEDRRAIFRHVLFRSVLLFALGVLYNTGFSASAWESVRWLGVLQRAALVYFFASVLVLTTDIRTQAATAAAILAGYWVVMRFIPVPGYAAGVLSPTVNMVRYVDLHLLPGQPYWDTWDPEGLLSTVPAVATGLFGVLAGHWLRAGQASRSTTAAGAGQPPWGAGFSPVERARYLFLAGVAGAALGLLVGLVFPINKSLWSSSYALLSGGLSAMLLAGFYWLIDVRGHARWAFPFVVIGMNSLFIYLLVNWVPFDEAARRLLLGAGLAGALGPGLGLVQAFLQLSLEWLLLFWMFRRRLFVRL